MSNRIRLLLLLIVAYCYANAQNASPYWSLAGNSNASTTSKLGTTNGIPLRLVTKNAERLRIDSNGRVSIGTTTPFGRFTIFNGTSVPAAAWKTTVPVFSAFGETTGGTGDFILSMASNTYNTRGVFMARRARGTLAAPLAVKRNDLLLSFLAAGYDGTKFQNPASIDFVVDGPISPGSVPTAISFSTTNGSHSREEQMRITSGGGIMMNGGATINGYVNIGAGLSVSGLDFAFNASSSLIAIQAYGGDVGIQATALEGPGVLGININDIGGIGVKGEGSGGVVGEGRLGVRGSGSIDGIVGITTGDDVRYEDDEEIDNSGVYGENQHIGAGVRGYSKGIGVQGTSSQSHGVYGATENASSYAGYFAGRVFGGGGFFTSSDQKLKKDIRELSSAMDIIQKLQPKSYEYRHEGAYKLMNLPQGKHFGLIAQDVEKVLPELVHSTVFNTKLTRKLTYDSLMRTGTQELAQGASEKIDFKAVNYTELIPIMVKAMQEQEQENSELKARVRKLEEAINKLLDNGNAVSFSNASLGTARPNPVNGSTTVSYNLPEGSRTAHIRVSDMKGSIIKQINLSGKGSGQVQLSTASLAAGTYTYSLFVDGAKVDSKQLLVAR